MANIPYHKITTPSGSQYMNINCPGAPAYFRIQFSDTDNLWYAVFTYDGLNWFQHFPGNATAAGMQTALDNFITSLNAGTVSS